MIVYYFLIFIIPLISIISYICNYRSTNNFLIFILLIISFFIGYRDPHIGTDTRNYIDFFANTPSEISLDYLFNNGSPLFQLILYIYKSIGASASTVLFTLSVIFNFFLAITLKKLKNIGPSYLLIFITSLTYLLLSLNIIRQGLAIITFVLFVFSQSTSPKYKNYILLLFSISFHPSAFFGLILYFCLKKIEINSIKAFFITFCSLLIILFNIDISSYIVSTLKLVHFMPNLVSRIEYYVTDYDVEGSNISIGYLTTCLIGVTSLIYKKKLQSSAIYFYGRSDIVRVSLNFTFINIAMYPVLAPFAAISRFSFYFYPFEIFLSCIMLHTFLKKKSLRICLLTLTALCLYIKAIVSGISYGFL